MSTLGSNRLNKSNNRDEEYFERIKRSIKLKLKIQIDQYKDTYIKRRISIRMRACGCKTYEEYYKYLTKNPEEYNKLEETLTVNVTEFFRDKTVYEELKKIFEKMLNEKKDKTIRVWSAGCSSGEEPYSIAIILNELIEKLNKKNFKIQIIGVDIDKEVLEKAKKGIYHIKQLRNLTPSLLDKYFTKVDDEHYQVRPILKKYVQFRYHDLIKYPPLKDMDVILCRNVIIYFSKELQEKLFLKFYEALRDGGYLILGKTEMLHGKARDLFKPVNHRERIYQKIANPQKSANS